MERIKKILPIILVWGTALFLFVLPFFWFKPGEMDLGGDSSRLYFYNPIAYLQNYALYGISPSNFGNENIGYFMIPFVLLLTVLKSLFGSSTLLIAAFHGVSFSIAFLAMYGIVHELLRKEDKKHVTIESISSFLAGLLYVLSQISIQGWDKVLVTHNQFFLNPLVFFLLLKYLKTDKKMYLVTFLLISFIFSPNFSFVAAPGFFSFYPLGILFLFLYRFFILKKNILWKHVFFTLVGLISLQAFHIVPQIMSMFSAGSVLNTTIFSNAGKLDRGLSYFSAIAPDIKVSLNILLLPQMMSLYFFSFLFIFLPLIIITGLIFNKSKTVLLTAAFFLIVLFFESANITTAGLNFYKSLFNLPGFAMFRNFYGQWGYMFLFFYSILFGQTVSSVLLKLRMKYRYIIIFCIIIILVLGSIPFLNGSLINKAIWQSNNMYVFTKFDPSYENAISYLRSLPGDEKVLTLPLTDPGYQIISGINDGAYQGPSTVSYLTGKKDFAGAIELGIFQQSFIDAVKQENYSKIQSLLTALGIRYVFYDSDPRSYEKGFPTFPYTDVRKYLPKTQKEYQTFLTKLDLTKKKQFGYYAIYERNSQQALPPFFLSQKNVYTNVNADSTNGISSLEGNNRFSAFSADASLSSYGNSIDSTVFKVDTTTAFSDFLQERSESGIPSAFISQSLDSIAYPFAVNKEKHYLNSMPTITDDYIDRAIFFADKRLNELDKFGMTMPLLGNIKNIDDFDKTWQEPSLISLGNQNGYNSWEVSLVRYKRQMSDLIRRMNGSVSSIYSKNVNKRYLKKIFDEHQVKLNNVIFSNKQNPDDQKYLLHFSENMFDALRQQVKVTLPDPSSLDYHLSVPIEGNYSVFLNNSDFVNFSHWSLQIQNKIINEPTEQNQGWSDIQNVHLKNGNNNISKLTVDTYQNLLADTEWIKNDKTLSAENGMSYVVDNSVTQDTQGIFRQISSWKPNSIYLLTFDYNSHGKHFFIKIHEQPDAEKNKNTEMYAEQLHSKDWQQFSLVVRSGFKANAGYLQIGKLNNNTVDILESDSPDKSVLDIKNISLVKIPEPTIIIQKNIKESQIEMPQTTFKKINSTKYLVTVKNVTKPFTLVFMNQFNNRWMLFPANKQNDGSVSGRFYNNQIVELQPEKNILDPRPLETLFEKPLFATSHFMVNGYENAWYIDPSALGNKKEYTFIVEMTTQRYFYIGMIISLAVFIITILYFFYILLRHEK